MTGPDRDRPDRLPPAQDLPPWAPSRASASSRSSGTKGAEAGSLTAAIRRARLEEAERSEVIAELRGAEVARLEMLADALAPVFAEVPESVDIFDTGIVAGERPRFFVDMIGFVEMGRDRRQYRFLQDTRYGRVVIAESERLDTMVEAVTAYVARRLVEREQALAGDRTIEDAARALADAAAGRGSGRRPRRRAGTLAVTAEAPAPAHRPGVLRFLLAVVDLVGALVVLLVLVLALWLAWRFGALWMAGQL